MQDATMHSNKMRTFAMKGLRNRVIEQLENNVSIDSVSATAQRLGVTRPSLSRILSDMLNESLLIKDGKYYKLLNNTFKFRISSNLLLR